MLTYGLPLTGFEAFKGDSLDGIAEGIARMGARLVTGRDSGDPLQAVANCVTLPHGQLWFCSYGVPIELAFREGDYYRLQVPIRGSGRTRLTKGAAEVAVAATQGCLSSAAASIDFGAHFQQLAWRVHSSAVTRKLHARIDRPIVPALTFQPMVRLDTAAGRSLLHTLACLVQVLAVGTSPHSLIVAELEQAMISGLLFASEHDFRDALENVPKLASPNQVRRAEEFIAANCSRALSIDEIAEAVGTSVRSLYRSFRGQRTHSPMEFLKRCRLNEARRLLEAADQGLSVTDVGITCGFEDLSHFSKEFLKAFGERPSTLARRARHRPR